jgi:hypothetical protein
MLTLPEHLSSSPVFSGVLVTRSLVLYVCFVDRCCPFVHFLFAIVLSVLLRFTDSDYLPLVSSDLFCTFSFGHCVVCSSSIYGFWLPPFGIFRLILYFFFWPLCGLFIFDLRILITPLVSSDLFCTFSFGHCVVCSSSINEFWFLLWYLQTYFVLFLLAIVLSVLLRLTNSDCPFGIFKLFFTTPQTVIATIT